MLGTEPYSLLVYIFIIEVAR